MNSFIKYNVFLILFSMVLCQQVVVCSWTHNIQSKFSNLFMKQKEESIDKKYTLQENGTLSIENIQGDINIKIGWEQNSIILKATKQIRKKDNFEDIEIHIDEQLEKNKVLVKTEIKNKKLKGSVHYELIIPKNIKICLKNKIGSIKINNFKGATYAKTEKGNIQIFDIEGIAIAVAQNGNIEISQANANIKAKTDYGNITIEDSSKGIHCQAKSGNINVSCKNVHSLNKISLYTQKGNIELCIPQATNADVYAITKKGKLTSDHFIHIKPQTVQLNNKTWDRFRREVNGTIGTGEALIKLSSNIGNINISKPIVSSHAQ